MIADLLTLGAIAVPYALIWYAIGYRDGKRYGR